MTMNPPCVSVIISTYTQDRWDDLCATVESVRRQSEPALEIVVVVDHNPHLLARIRAAMPDVVAVENQEAPGLSGARNSAVAVAQGAILAFLDDDAVAAPDWLARLTQGYDDPHAIGVGGAIEPRWPDRRPGWLPPEFDWVVGCTYRGMPERRAPVRNLIGANMSFRREVFAHVGGFRGGLGRLGTRPLGCEETEFCIRARQHLADSTLLYEPRARVRHRVTAQRTSWRYFRARCHAEGLSKALVARYVGATDGLASERTHALRTLPQGIVRNLGSALEGDPAGLQRAGAIMAGLMLTAAGYLRGTLAARRTEVAADVGDTAPLEVGGRSTSDRLPSYHDVRSACRPPCHLAQDKLGS
jgi:GT2 family glycosyltransferase